ncbi:MAG TPA: YdeI/OmpD-associated family protein [Terracidiphilus sp.]|jgi:uncharacterized protein YdeI (YjbR/CyaY-like superfamily)|nr:YdeI/OmpD-associated family protein [Terracidiphilus sp.]
MSAGKAKTFEVVLERHAIGLRFVVARLDGAALRKAWPEWKDRRVKGTINGVDLRTTLFPARQGAEMVLIVNRALQKGARAGPGDRVKLRLEPDGGALEPIPAELLQALKEDKAVARWFAKLPPSMRKGFGNFVDAARGAATRRARAAKMAESVMLAMEGEHETPPILRAGFQREPLAHAGWRAMTPLQRRNHLLGIFYLQTVQGRERRAAMAVDAAVRVAKRRRA